MTNQKDNWSQLLDDFGIDAPVENQVVHQEQVEVPAPVKPVAEVVSSPVRPAAPSRTGFGSGVIEDVPSPKVTPVREEEPQRQKPQRQEQQEPQKKKSFFGRFPKINLFGGAAAKEPLDAGAENVKVSSVSGKSFTSNKLEKVPTSRKPRQEEPEPPKPTAMATAESDPWSVLASQVDTLAEEKPQEKHQRGQQREQQREYGHHSSRRNNRNDRVDYRQSRQPVSIFDEPIPESEESLALKKLIGEQPKVVVEDIVEERRISYIDDEVSLPAKRGRGRGRDEKPQRRRGSSYDAPEPVAEDLREESREPQRGRRDSRFANAEPAYSEDRSERGSRPRRESRFEHKSKPVPRIAENAYEQDTMQDTEELLHRNIPSWDDAVGFLIENNIARHANSPGNSQRRGSGRRS
jgi:hypothetical protein